MDFTDKMATACSTLSLDLSALRVEKAPDSVYYVPNFITTSEEAELLRQPQSIWGTHHLSLAGQENNTRVDIRSLIGFMQHPSQNGQCYQGGDFKTGASGLPHPKVHDGHEVARGHGSLMVPEGMIQEELPQWLKKYALQLGSLSVFEKKIPNHVLVNEYEPGQGIMPHEDGPLFHPVVSTINLGSHTVLDFYTSIRGKEDFQEIVQQDESTESDSTVNARKIMSLLLEPRSLLILTGDLYKNYLHGIEERKQDGIGDMIRNLDVCQAKFGQTIERTTRISLTIRHVPKTLKVKLKIGK